MEHRAWGIEQKNMEKYPVYCSWCEKKGIKTVVNWTEVPGSSGICVPCNEDMMMELAALRAASGGNNGNNKMHEPGMSVLGSR